VDTNTKETYRHKKDNYFDNSEMTKVTFTILFLTAISVNEYTYVPRDFDSCLTNKWGVGEGQDFY